MRSHWIALMLVAGNMAVAGDVPQMRPFTQDEAARRAGALAVIAEMPLEEIEKLAVPLRYVLRHFAK